MAVNPRELHSSSTLDSESFKIYCYKIVPCAKKFGHDWSECPFAHEGEKATRRCPALYRYSSIVCPEIRQSKPCPRGDVCPYSHSIFEYWMHPARFRAQLCSFGKDCNRRICFFAHTQEQLRVPSEPVVADALAGRAPYLQGRVSPESRFALYPEQVPALIPVQGAPRMGVLQPQGQLLSPADLGSGSLQPQLLYMPTAGGQTMAVGAPAAASPAALASGQRWAAGGGGSMMFLPGAQSSGTGYYLAGGAGGAVGGAPAPEVLVAPNMQVLGSGYGSNQPVQLMTLPDGSTVQAYPLASGGVAAGSGMAYAPMYAASPAAGMTVQQQWASQQQPAQQQLLQGTAGSMIAQQPGGQPPPPPPLQLMQLPEADGAGAGLRGSQDQQFILTPAGQISGPRMQLESSYAMIGPGVSIAPRSGGATGTGGGMLQQGPGRPAVQDSAQGVNELAQQMAGWQIH